MKSEANTYLIGSIAALCVFFVGLVLVDKIITHYRCTSNGGRWEDTNCISIPYDECNYLFINNLWIPIDCKPAHRLECDNVCTGARIEKEIPGE